MKFQIVFRVHETKGGYVLTDGDDRQVAVATGLRSLRARVGEYAADQVEGMIRRAQEDEQSIKSAKASAGVGEAGD